MEAVIYYITVALYLWASVMSFSRQAHMFQLNSYSAATHIKWNLKNPYHTVSNIFAAAFCVIAVFTDVILEPPATVATVLYVSFALAFLLFALSNVHKGKDKTPLVYTARVKRLMFTFEVLAIAFAALSLYLYLNGKAQFSYGVLFAGYALLPEILLLANLINSPAEWSVKRYYLNDALKILRSCPELTVVGITGSYGKTSMKYFLSTILKQKYNVLVPPKNYNTPMGIVKTVRSELRGYHEIFVCEMGAKKVGEIKELCDIVSPKHGIITSIGPQHLESFKSIDNIVKTKFELSENLCGGKLFLNIDNEYIREKKPEGAVTYGQSEDADYRGTDISVSREGTEFTVIYPDGSAHRFKTVLIGSHNVTNLCGAIAMAKELGVDDDGIESGIMKITPVPHRLELSERGNLTVIDDAYNSNPNGCRAALETLGYFDEYKILVTPGMVELGEKEEELNREFGTEVAAVCDFVILVGEKQTRPILAGLHDAAYPDDKIYVADSLSDAMNKVYSIETDRRKCVLLENDLPDNY
ncbi:MAG: UDP-N-acetylmuramoyl-tripeptide--D-alanyl-D-alanine ligase [Clostridia bacterium]|nr:UDP-N-acetylmuramoyl-tripeptide--D-alanyl-D-alanine ligase [Clostridia bacterium]